MEGFGAHAAGGSSGTFGATGSSRGGDDPWLDRRRNDDYLLNRQAGVDSGESSVSSSCFGVMCFLLIPLFVLVSLATGWESPLKIEAGVGYSRLLDTNPLFVREIEVKKIQGAGEPVVYTFPRAPALEERLEWFHEADREITAYSHQEWALWLNKGSTMTLTYNIRGGQIIFAVSQGLDKFQSWVENPWNPSSSLYWQQLEGDGVLEFDVEKNGDYYYSFGNMNHYPVEMALRLEAQLKIYSTKQHDSKCSLKSQPCKVALPLLHSTAVLLTTSDRDGLQHISVTYKTRWATIVAAFGTLAAVVVVLVKRPWKRSGSTDEQQEEKTKPEEASPMLEERSVTEQSGVYNRLEECSRPNPGEEESCAVCLDAAKDCFFDPCGHCATCYECGKRIKASGNAICPICRENIRVVRRLFVS